MNFKNASQSCFEIFKTLRVWRRFVGLFKAFIESSWNFGITAKFQSQLVSVKSDRVKWFLMILGKHTLSNQNNKMFALFNVILELFYLMKQLYQISIGKIKISSSPVCLNTDQFNCSIHSCKYQPPGPHIVEAPTKYYKIIII